MNCKIRHLFIPAMTVVAYMVSCTSGSEQTNPATAEAMRFEVAKGTRVVATTNENIIDQPFMLFGDVSSGGAYYDGVKPIFYWDSVAYDSGQKTWDYGVAKQYWFMGQEHSFVAIHPYIPRDGSDSQVSILDYKDSELSFTYVLPEKLENAKDLLFATHRRKYSLNNTGPVRFEFTHLLARINISLALIESELMYDHVDENDTQNNTNNKNEYIKVHSLEFHGIKTTASFSFTPKSLTNGSTSTYDYEKSYLIRDDDRKETIVVTLKETCKVPNSYKDGADEQVLEYVTALKDNEIVVMLPQTFGSDSDAKMVVNYSINDDIDLCRKIVIPLKNTTWKEGTSYTYKLLIDNPYYSHVIEDGKITVDIDDFRLHGDKEVGDDSWITDDEDEDHNIKYGYDDNGNCGPIQDNRGKY